MADTMRDRVREKYAGLAVIAESGEEGPCCCGDSCGCGGTSGESSGERVSDLTGGSYAGEDLGSLPEGVAGASLGCGNPVVLAALEPGEVVLDLGSGGGLDVLLSARRVAPGGRAYGLDMTDEMLALARENQREAGVANAEFLKGEIEAVPLPDAHVDVVLSNCVVNLSTEKPRVLSESFRVLKPGGRLAVSDVVFLGNKAELPEDVREAVDLWTGCIAGALEKDEYEALLEAAGFEDISVETTNVYEPAAVEGLDTARKRDALRRVPAASAFIRARKPTGASAGG